MTWPITFYNNVRTRKHRQLYRHADACRSSSTRPSSTRSEQPWWFS